MDQTEIDAVSRQVYKETARFYSGIESQLGAAALGFKILYSPPDSRPPVMFIGYQPGGGPIDRDREIAAGAQKRWPRECEYAIAAWPLAANMQRMFGIDFLSRCVGMNAIFFRARNRAEFKSGVPSALRRQMEEFSMERVHRLIACIDPQVLVFIGFDALRLFGPTSPILRNEAGRGLIEQGEVAGRSAFGVIHLSGAQISNADRACISSFVTKASG